MFLDSKPYTFKGYVRQALCLYAGLADEEHAARIAMEAVFDYRDIDVDGIAGFELALARNPVTNDMIYRGTNGFRESAVV